MSSVYPWKKSGGRSMIPQFDRKAALLEQREHLRGRARQTEAMIHAIDVALAALDGNGEKRIDRVEDLFAGFNPSQYHEEVRRRWGRFRSVRRIEETDRALHAG